MRIFVTGASGYIGHAVTEALVRGGHQVTGLVRNTERAALVAARGGTPIIGDLAEPSSYRDLVHNHEAVVHAAMEGSPRGAELDRIAIETMLGALKEGEAGPRVFVYTSGVWVLGSTREPATEESPVNPPAQVAWRPAHEQQVLGASGDGLRTVVVRPGIVYGGGRGIIADLMRDAANGLVRVIGGGDNHWAAVYDRDLADLYLRIVTRPEASGLYHANDEADERVNEMVEAIAAAVPQAADIRRMPLEEARAKLGAYADALALDQVVRSPRARALGWSPARRSVAANATRLFEEWRAAREA
ncbi:MAG TPA: NAD-dependent epimerase/dehydratase family protein [Vicinamibacterales bacterium]|nr:NAD-dependent epimerase/dehydratase family protein [Vicinamibacterales bacterium]